MIRKGHCTDCRLLSENKEKCRVFKLSLIGKGI